MFKQNEEWETKKTKCVCNVGTSLQVLYFHLLRWPLNTEVSPEGTQYSQVHLERREILPSSSVVILQWLEHSAWK